MSVFPWFRMKNSTGRLFRHVLHYQSAERHFTCSGTKQPRAIMSMYRCDLYRGRRQADYLRRSAVLIWSSVGSVVLAPVECRQRVPAHVVRIRSAFHKQGDQHWSTRRSSCREHVLRQGVRGCFASTPVATGKSNQDISEPFFQCDVQLRGCVLGQMLPENAKTIWPIVENLLALSRRHGLWGLQHLRLDHSHP